MIGARVGLRVAPQVVSADERPSALAGCPGTVARLDEPVLAPESLLAALVAGNARRVLQIDQSTLEIDRAAGTVRRVQLTDPATGRRLHIEPRHVVLTAGRGNADLRARAGLPATVMQTRPLHMVLVRGDLPHLNGHCVDGRTTRVTITSDTERSDTAAAMRRPHRLASRRTDCRDRRRARSSARSCAGRGRAGGRNPRTRFRARRMGQLSRRSGRTDGSRRQAAGNRRHPPRGKRHHRLADQAGSRALPGRADLGAAACRGDGIGNCRPGDRGLSGRRRDRRRVASRDDCRAALGSLSHVVCDPRLAAGGASRCLRKARR